MCDDKQGFAIICDKNGQLCVTISNDSTLSMLELSPIICDNNQLVCNINAVLAAVENDPSFFEVAFHGLLSEDALMRMPAASSMEYCEAEKTIPAQKTNSGQKTV
jgi:hypothetical protein